MSYVCTQNSVAPEETIDELHNSQAGEGRHKCVICAYKAGVEDGMKKMKVKALQAIDKLDK